MTFNKGEFSFPGIGAYESVTFTDTQGISPAIALVTLYPAGNWPDLYGDMVFSYNGQVITIQGCTIDSAQFHRNSGGKTVTLRILDSRYRWAYGQITLRTNIRLPNNFVDPNHEMTPKQIASLCFQAMGESIYDVSVLPDDARPDIDWEGANPAQSLAKMCDDLGCRIVPVRSTGGWAIVVSGVGEALPEDLPYCDGGEGVDPKELPDFIQILTAPITYQCALPLEAIGRDLDQSWKPLADLTYAPIPDDESGNAWGFGKCPQNFGNLPVRRYTLGDGTAISYRELATRYIFKAHRVDVDSSQEDDPSEVNGFPAIFIDGYDDYVSRKQMILSDRLVQCWTDDRGEIHPRPAYVFGQYERKYGYEGFSGRNYDPGTRIDYQASSFQGAEEPFSFNFNPDPIDTDRSIITTTQQARFVNDQNPPALDVNGKSYTPTTYQTAILFYVCGIEIRHPETWQPIRYARIRQIGNGSDLMNVYTVIKNDIQPWFINLYNPDGTFSSNTNNQDEVNAQCDFYLDQLQPTFQTINTVTRTYIGLFSIDMDGGRQQVTYRIGRSGCDTVASFGTEHNFDLPPYAERRQRDGRQGSVQRQELNREIDARRQAKKGTFNTL